MPKVPIDYSKTIIYELVCNDTNIKDCYLGHTTSYDKRKNTHKESCCNENSTHYNLKVYQFIRANGGWNNWSMIMIEEYVECENKLQALQKERYYIETLNATLNSNIPGRTNKEYHDDNKTYYKDINKQWRENNKDYMKEYMIEYFKNNKDILSEKMKEYRKNNKDTLSEKQKVKLSCECGSIYNCSGKSIHQKSLKHQKFLNQQQQPI